MNKEIKEILDNLAKKSSIYKMQINRGTSFNTDEYEASLLLNYITNLQKENERSQQKINKALNKLNRIPDGLENINAYVALIVNETKEILQGDNKE